MRELSREDVPSTWMGAALWDPGWPAGERITESKGPVEAKKDDVAGIDACNKTREAWPHQNQSESGTIHEGTATHLLGIHQCPNPSSWALDVKKPIHFRLEAHRKGAVSSWRDTKVFYLHTKSMSSSSSLSHVMPMWTFAVFRGVVVHCIGVEVPRESQDDVHGRQEAWVHGDQRGGCEQAKGGHG